MGFLIIEYQKTDAVGKDIFMIFGKCFEVFFYFLGVFPGGNLESNFSFFVSQVNAREVFFLQVQIFKLQVVN
jgi:hypothetical protein